MNEITYGPGGFDPSHPNGNIIEQVVDNGDGTGTRTLYGPDGQVTGTEALTGLPIPDPPAADPAAAVLAAVQTARNEVAGYAASNGYQSDIVIDSPDGTPYRLVVANDGTLSTEGVT